MRVQTANDARPSRRRTRTGWKRSPTTTRTTFGAPAAFLDDARLLSEVLERTAVVLTASLFLPRNTKPAPAAPSTIAHTTMATLASRYPAPAQTTNMAAHYRIPPTNNAVFSSPTESEFSYKDGKESVLDWDEARVAEWLRSINCSDYVDIFKKNNINGENLMDMDQKTLKDMGVKKVGDRVRIGNQAKVFRNNVYKRTSKRNINRVSR